MDNTLLIGLSRQVALRRQMDVIAQNMANVNTPGFKGDELMFREYLMPVARANDVSGEGRNMSFVLDTGINRNFEAGRVDRTDNELDVAVFGKGWLVVETKHGERYTRNGSLKINPDGQLVTSEGHPIQGDGGPITFAPGESKIAITRDGVISSSAGQKGKFRVVKFQDERLLKKEGASLYALPKDVQPEPAEEYRIAQGMLERSNVQAVVEMTRMIEVMRAYQSTTRTMEKTDRLKRDAIERLASIPR